MFIKEHKIDWMFWRGVLLGAFFMGLFLAALGKITQTDDPAAKVEMPKTVIQAYKMGAKDALSTNPPSMDLEMVCVGLWANKQPVR